MSSENKGGGLGWFILGAAVGAAAGLLLAPRSGEESRDRLAGWLKERREKGIDLVERVKGETQLKREALASAAKAAKDAYRETVS